ncbi:acetylornithine deacetylase/succinyl-diaminopimelate desuccinylase-like protein [Bradyrhizobium elkanii]|nr:acetylornithine deacetylase/succinyl-diaminopimelate desuccinylase-like protein [Bradyrhizobium elkanii]
MSSNPFEAAVILDGIRRWVEIESPTERPDQVNKLADLVASGYRDLSVSVDRVAGRDGCGDHLVTRSSWGQGVPGILVLSHLDTVHPMGFIERLPFKVEGNRAFGPGIYDMKVVPISRITRSGRFAPMMSALRSASPNFTYRTKKSVARPRGH